MDNLQSNQNNGQQRHFIFPGLRELLLGITVIVVIETLIGTSVLATLPLQHMFFASVLISVYLLMVSLLLSYWFTDNNEGDPLGLLLGVPALFCSGFYFIGLLFPALAIDYPTYTEPVDIYFLDLVWHLLKCAWAIVTQISHIYGWFTIISCGVLLIHIYTKCGKDLNNWLNSFE